MEVTAVKTDGGKLVAERPAAEFIVATETGIMHRMEKLAPQKAFLAVLETGEEEGKREN
mgnify:CR=1 FL=1